MDWLDKKSAGSVLLLVLLFHGIWHSRHFVERATESLRRMTYMYPSMPRHIAQHQWSMIIIPEDIYHCLILDEVAETARFLKQPRIKRQ